MLSSLHGFLAPGSIAVVGASTDPTKRGYKAMMGLQMGGYQGAIYPVNPTADEILGVKAYPSLAGLPASVDMALICTPANTVAKIIEQCGHNGVKGVIILASGFGEVDESGAQIEQDILNIARKMNVRIIGPNTSGMFNLHKNINLLALDNIRSGGVGVISQSGNMLLALALEAEGNGRVGFSTYVGPGNQIDLGFSDYLQFLGEEENTKVAVLYVEGFKDGRRFLDIARQVAKTKPIVVYKSGSTEAGRKAASSHTGTLAGSYCMAVDLLRQAGVTVVSRSDEILPVAEGMGLFQYSPGKRVAVLADGGGQATIASDRLSEAGLQLAVLSDTTQLALREILFSQASVLNPVDVAGSTDAHPGLLFSCMEILANDAGVDMVFLVGMFGGYGVRFADGLKQEEIETAKAMSDLSRQTDKSIIIYSLYAHSPIELEPIAILREAGLPVVGSIEVAVQIMKGLGERGIYLEQSALENNEGPIECLPDAADILIQAQSAGRDLFEFEAKSLLRAYGVGVPTEIIIRKEAELCDVIAEFGDIPMAMKIVSRDILHKTDAGGVQLNLSGMNALRQARIDILNACKAYNADADIEGLLVTPMARKGVEIIIGVGRDPIFGPVLMFGLGGIFVEVLEDVTFRAIPLSRGDAGTMINEIKGRRILSGVRNEAAVDTEALVDLLVKVSQIVEVHPEIVEMDLNPVLAYNDGYAVVDARIIVNRGEIS